MRRRVLLLAVTGLLLSSACEKRHFKDFDVGASTWDPNAFPLNPKWGKQIEQNTIPNPYESCPIESDSDDVNDWTSSPQFPNCTSFTVTFNGGFWCGPHINFMPVAYEGTVTWNGTGSWDDDYTFNVTREDLALYSTAGHKVHIEFDSEETVDNWDDTNTWWDRFHHDGVKAGDAVAGGLINGSFAMVIGLLNLDSECHDIFGDCKSNEGKTELHPVYAMFVQLKPSDLSHPPPPAQSSWAFFVRNWGNQGFCSSEDKPLTNLDIRHNQIKVKIPNVAGLISHNIWEGARNDDDFSPMQVIMQPYGDGVLMTFTLLAPEKQSWFVGDVTFATRPPVSIEHTTTSASATGEKKTDTIEPAENDNPFPDLQAQLDKLPQTARIELNRQLENLIPKKKSYRTTPILLDQQAKVEDRNQKSPVKVLLHRGKVRAGSDPSVKLNQQKRIDFIRRFLKESRVK